MVVNQPPPDPTSAIVQGVEAYNNAQDAARKIAEEAVKRAQEQRDLEAQMRNRTQTHQPR